MPKTPSRLKIAAAGAKVEGLETALGFLLERKVILPHDDARRQQLLTTLSGDEGTPAYQAAAQEVVDAFQRERSLASGGGADPATVAALNGFLPHAADAGRPALAFTANPTRTDIGNLQQALRKLDLTVAPDELKSRTIGGSTTEAIKKFQRDQGLAATGAFSSETIERMKVEVDHRFFATSKGRVERLQTLLGRLGRGIDRGEQQARTLGPSTEAAIKAFQTAAGLVPDGRLNDAVVAGMQTAALKAQLAVKTQVGYVQRKILRAAKVAKIDGAIEPAEIKAKQLGPSAKALVQKLQAKYRLNPNGEIDVATLEKLDSIAASRTAPVSTVKVRTAQNLVSVKRALRLNMTNKYVPDLQKALAFAGQAIDVEELKAGSFGRTTRDAVIAFQKLNRLPVTGHADGKTLRSLNKAIAAANPSAAAAYPNRIRGSVRDELWRGRAGVAVQIWEMPLRGEGQKLAERPSLPNGFFDIPYTTPRDPNSGQAKTGFQLETRFVDGNGTLLGTKRLFNPTQIAWANFTQGDLPYRGPSEFELRMATASKCLGAVSITDLRETENTHEVTQLALNAALSQDDVMRLLLSARAAGRVANATITAPVFYAFIRQNLPPSLPGELLAATNEWELIDQIVDQAISGIAFMQPELQADALANAAKENFIPIEVSRNKDAVLKALAALAQSFALEKPLLAGNGSLQTLLQVSNVPVASYAEVAKTFVKHQQLEDGFWEEMTTRSADFGGPEAVKDFHATTQIGEVTKNFTPILTALKAKIDNPADAQLKSPRDLAKLGPADWKAIITSNGGAVPPNTDGATEQDKIDIYAATLVNQSERLFPDVALVAEIARSNENSLQHIVAIETLVDSNPDLNLRNDNLDSYVATRNLALDENVMVEARALQRVHRLAPSSTIARALLDEKIHHSAEIMSLGKERFVEKMKVRGIDQKAALTVYSYAEFQYGHIMMRLGELRNELRNTDPSVLNTKPMTVEEQQALLGNIPNLETLFGSLDYCDCEHCQSVYGPAAYLADVLRFLDAHPSETANRTVRDILFDRRPDLGNVKLNCINSETPLPYIDLVCEVLENAVEAPAANANFSFQTNLTAEELRAYPENQRAMAYDVLRAAKFPVSGTFDLWQEEARTFLGHLGVDRHDLMRTFQTGAGAAAVPSETSIAGEFFGLNSQDTGLVVQPKPAQADQDVFFGFDTSRAKIPVLEFLQNTGLDYVELLDLLSVKWVNPAGDANPIQIERPSDTCGLDKQSLLNLTPARFDRIHRLIRFWRHTPWALWELDLLLRQSAGSDELDGTALARLMAVRQVQDRFVISAEVAAALYAPINTEARAAATHPPRRLRPLYDLLFQSTAITNPVNSKFALPLSGADPLTPESATLLAALSLGEDDLVQLVKLTDGKLTLDNLSLLFRHAELVRGMRVSVQELLSLFDLIGPGAASPFASPSDTLAFVEQARRLLGSGVSIGELEYLFTYRPDSPYGLRDDVIAQNIDALRETLRAVQAGQAKGAAITHAATVFGLTDDQAKVLLENLTFGADLLASGADAALMEKDANSKYVKAASEANFPALYKAYQQLHKASMIVARNGIAASNLDWLMSRFTGLGGLDWNKLPVDAAPAASLIGPWVALSQWLAVLSQFPQPEGVTLTKIFDGAADAVTSVETLRDEISKLTTWNVDDLKTFDGGNKAGYAIIGTFVDLVERFRVLKRCGVSATVALGWAARDNDAAQFATAQQVRQAGKSKYDPVTWLDKLAPLQDALREKKRTALTMHLIQFSSRTALPAITVNGKQYANPKRWRDTNALLGYFLIDVEMGSLQLTSRIKQAIGSAQMFVQRCFLNLEQPFVQVSRAEQADTVSLNSWRQWKWMKSYRIWEANRKVFLYPENWIEPELRDDKSPFFKEFESALMQSDMTNDNAETAFSDYLEKAHQVARLDVTGIYHEIDDDNPYDNLPPNINTMHVIARTRSDPAVYFYRTFDVNYNVWSPWEKIDLDITGDHVVPVVYNRKLHLFWLLFTAKPQKVRKVPKVSQVNSPNDQGDSPEPQQQLEIQLAWSVRKNGGWQSRSVSPHKLVHPWPRPTGSYNVKPRYKSRENQLWMDIYISTSEAFNNGVFYDPYQHKMSRLTGRYFDETGRPWHSSSFVFDGQVIDLRLKPLSGQFHIFDTPGIDPVTLVPTTSYAYVWNAFGGKETKLATLTGPYQIAPRLVLPAGMHFENTRLVNNVNTPNASSFNVVEAGQTRTILAAAKAPFQLVMSQDHIQLDAGLSGKSPFFYQDRIRTFFVKTEWKAVHANYSIVGQKLKYTFFPFYHPYTALFIRELNRSGLDGLLNRRIQTAPQTYYPTSTFDFKKEYQSIPGVSVSDPTARSEVIDFSRSGASSLYNWEIFFHMPFMVACKLSQNQRFEEAMQWFHYIFDPTSTEALSVPQRFWITKPFFDQTSDDYRRQRIQELLENISANLDQVRDWKNNPFKPDVIARYRPAAYQKAVLMKYVDNLIAWGDQLFRQDTIEAINEATTLYVLAYEIMGRRPVKVPDLTHEDRSYNELVADGALDPFGNKRVEVLMENFVDQPKFVIRNDEGTEPLPTLDVLYFCIPPNDRLMEYWTTIEDRLFKIRHSMNISGAVRRLPLFEPPIDPALLVKAVAAGVDIGSVLADLATPQGPYRFPTLVAKALEICNEVRSLGEKVLSAIEKRDAEMLAALRSGHETAVLKLMKDVRKQQIEEASMALASAEAGTDLIQESIDYYGGIPRMNSWEELGVIAHGLGIVSEIVATVLNSVAGATHLIPDIQAGAAGMGGTPTMTLKIGGQMLGNSSTNFAALFQGLASILHQGGQMLDSQGGYTRRDEENKHQVRAAQKQMTQLEKQIETARLRTAITETELTNLDAQIEQSQAVEEYLRSKYSNTQLYDWLLSQLAAVYFQAYQMAYDTAKRAQKSMQVELGQSTETFIQFGYWDSLRKGLLAGDRLLNDIRRMEIAYLDNNRRELELTKHVSLAQIAPLALVALKQSGRCSVQVPEWLYDLDYPGHYYRRIRSASISIPSVVGPYTNVNCMLSLTRNAIRVRDGVAGGYGDPLAAADDRFASSVVPISAIATSHGMNDSGLFELNFNDARYLPFETAGAVSEWDISLPKTNNQFDFAAISDVILHIRYTARPGSLPLQEAARANTEAAIPLNGAQIMVLNREFAGAWQRLLFPNAGQDQQFVFTLAPENLPFLARARAALSGKSLKATRIDIVAETAHTGGFDVKLEPPGDGAATDEAMPKDAAFDGAPHLQKVFAPAKTLFGDWKMAIKKDNAADFKSLKAEDIRNAYLIVHYTIA
ncbi:neuraminidase-like domain-containing protein [Mesorhizobium sp. M0060]|uniref:Tc toxin subunit A-related protein n=1 Tax=Mesorhizobium sp. M0060 TaxID=2956866 RepID=UPI00333D4205